MEHPAENLAQLAANNDWARIEESFLNPALSVVIRDSTSESLVLSTARWLNSLSPVSSVSGNYSPVHFLLWSSCTRADDVELLKKFLTLGVDPNLASGGAAGWRPGHYCAAKGWGKCLEALLNAGLDVDAESQRPGETVMAVAVRNKRQEIVEALNRSRELGLKPIAQLAQEQLWYAVLNRVRRRNLCFDDYVITHHGKTVLEWSKIHRNDVVTEEVEYWMRKFLPSCQIHPSPTPSLTSSEDSQLIRDLKNLVEKQQQVLNDVVTRLISLEGRVRAVSPKPNRRSLLIPPSPCQDDGLVEPSVPSGELITALDQKISSVGAMVVERDADLSAKVDSLQKMIEQVFAFSNRKKDEGKKVSEKMPNRL